MSNKTYIWIWLQNKSIMKAILDSEEGILMIFDEKENLVLKRTGLNKEIIKQMSLM